MWLENCRIFFPRMLPFLIWILLSGTDAFLRVVPSSTQRLALFSELWSNHAGFSTCTTKLWMGKGDGKQKRKKKSNQQPSPPTPSPSPSPEPMRVTSDSNIPVKHQLRWAKMNQEYRKQQSNPGFRQKRVVRTKFRKVMSDEEMELKAEARRRKGQDPDWDVILSRNAVSPLVIVDGYNICYNWARLKKHMTKGDIGRARQLLIDDLEDLASLKNWRIEVVFDGTRRSTVGPLGQGPGTSSKPTRIDRESKASLSKHGVRVVYSGVGMEADTYIESRCMDAKNVTDGQITGSFIVATDDAMIRMAGQSAGAWCMGADRFVNELKACRAGISYRVEAAVAKVNGQSIRPQKLRATAPTRFRNSAIIEDKRNKTKTKNDTSTGKADIQNDLDIEVEENENGVPWWAQVGDANPNRY